MKDYCYRGEPIMDRLDRVPRSEIKWLWPGRVPLGKLTLIAGDPGLGKSFVTLDMIARTTVGAEWPDGAPCVIRRRCDDAPSHDDPKDGTMGSRTEPVGADCVLLSAEDDPADTIRPRLESLNADLRRVAVVHGVHFRDSGFERSALRLDRDIEAIDGALAQRPRPRLVVIDPISAYMGQTDCNSNAEVRSVLMRLGEVAAARGVAVVCVTHLNKGGAGNKAVYRAMGSLAFTAAARMVWSVMKDPDEPERRLLLPVKSNIAGDSHGLAYRLIAGKLTWDEGAVVSTADEVERTGESAPLPGEFDDAIGWLRGALAGGPAGATDLIAQARGNLISERTLKRAKRELGVVSARRTSPNGSPEWVWSLPEVERSR